MFSKALSLPIGKKMVNPRPLKSSTSNSHKPLSNFNSIIPIQCIRNIPGALSSGHMMQLQRIIGNRAVGRLLSAAADSGDCRSRSGCRKDGTNHESKSGLPKNLKNGIETISHLPMDDVTVHSNSSKPAEFQAWAHTQGSDIYLGPNQEKHLPHEAWHVVQQKQCRVKSAAVQFNGVSINDDSGLEREADVMGARASKNESGAFEANETRTATTLPVQPEVMQRNKKVPTDFGEFETTKFAESEGRGVEITLKFNPAEDKVDAKKIALSQSVKTTLSSGTAYAIDPNQAGRMVASGKSGAGYYTDQLSDINSPIYTEDVNLGAAKTLADTPLNTTDPDYTMGYCYKEKPSDANKKKFSAALRDTPRGGKKKGESKTFETTAFAIDGTDKDRYYGSVKWGYKMEGTDVAPTVTKMDIDLASKGTPTANFIEPAKLWNAAKTRGTLQVTTSPEATVLKGDASGTEKLAKDKKLKQLETIMWGTDPAVKAEVLKADGTGSGKIVYIKVSDVKDMSDGTANKKLPVPAP